MTMIDESKRERGDAPSIPLAEWRGRGTILIADDEDLYCEVFRALLVDRGFDVTDVRDGVAAVRAFHAFGRDIVAVLMDDNMPRMGGPDAARIIRETAPAVPIVSVSPRDSVNDLYQPGVIDAYVCLPCRKDDLLRVLKRVLKA